LHRTISCRALIGRTHNLIRVAAAIQERKTMTRVLIVDDEPQIRRILLVMLGGQGFEAAEAGSGEEALEICKPFKPDVILLDVSLPGMNGLATLQALLQEDHH